MHKKIGKLIEKEMGEGEKHAPVKSLKLKVKFSSPKSKALKSK